MLPQIPPWPEMPELELEAIPEHRPGPRHTVGVDFIPATSHGPIPYLKVWCSCGWNGLSIRLDRAASPERLAVGPLEEAARNWRLHVRLSNVVLRTDKRLRRAAARARQEEEE